MEDLHMGIPPEEDPAVQEQIKQQEAYDKSLIKKELLSKLEVNQHNVPFDANETAQNNMTSVLAIANWQFNKNISPTLTMVANMPTTDDVSKSMLLALADIFNGLYDNVYKQEIFWKGADNKPHRVQAETIAEALFKAMNAKKDIIKENI